MRNQARIHRVLWVTNVIYIYIYIFFFNTAYLGLLVQPDFLVDFPLF